MKNTGLRWRFVNQSNANEIVIVHDQASADTLADVLQRLGGDWMMFEERSLGSSIKNAPEKKESEVAASAPPVVEPVRASAPHHEESVEEHHEHESEYDLPDHDDDHFEDEPVAAPKAAVVPPPAPKKQEKKERRAQQRYMTEFRVILISGTSSFRTMSQDVSLGGMRLKKSIPATFMNEKCIAYVSHKDLRENIEIVCNVIGDPSDPCRIKFVQPNPMQLKRLSDWLAEHNPDQKKVAS